MIDRVQSWQDCDTDIKQFVLKLVELLKRELDDNLTGIYLHGSLAMGSYYRPKSDIDIILVVNNKLLPEAAEATNKAIARLAESRPTTGDIELSVITAETAQNVTAAPPFELHYSSEWHDQILNGKTDYTKERTDTDLPSHLTYVKQHGICLYGKPIERVFGEIKWQYFIKSVIDDYNWILEDENILETPFYGILNICRVLQLVSENSQRAHSKDEGGEWGLQNLPNEFHGLINQALAAYRSNVQVNEADRRTNGQTWEKDQLLAFRDYARQAISAYRFQSIG